SKKLALVRDPRFERRPDGVRTGWAGGPNSPTPESNRDSAVRTRGSTVDLLFGVRLILGSPAARSQPLAEGPAVLRGLGALVRWPESGVHIAEPLERFDAPAETRGP